MILRVTHLFKTVAYIYSIRKCRDKYEVAVYDAFIKKHWNIFLKGKV